MNDLKSQNLFVAELCICIDHNSKKTTNKNQVQWLWETPWRSWPSTIKHSTDLRLQLLEQETILRIHPFLFCKARYKSLLLYLVNLLFSEGLFNNVLSKSERFLKFTYFIVIFKVRHSSNQSLPVNVGVMFVPQMEAWVSLTESSVRLYCQNDICRLSRGWADTTRSSIPASTSWSRWLTRSSTSRASRRSPSTSPSSPPSRRTMSLSTSTVFCTWSKSTFGNLISPVKMYS